MGILRILFYSMVLLYIVHYFVGIPVMTYTLKVKTVKEIARKYSTQTYSASHIRREFKNRYPQNILEEEDFMWLPCSTGGLHGSVAILYASFTELLVLYHAKVDTTGHTGRHFMNVSVTVLEGEATLAVDSSKPRAALKLLPGDSHVLRMLTSSVVKLNSRTSLLIYSRGIVPATMFYWIADTVFVNCDPFLAAVTIWFYIKATVMSQGAIMAWFNQSFHFLWRIASEGLEYLLKLPQLVVSYAKENFAW